MNTPDYPKIPDYFIISGQMGPIIWNRYLGDQVIQDYVVYVQC